MDAIGVIHNPFARQNLRKKHLAGELKSILKGKGCFFETGHVDELDSLARECLAKETGVLGINGGDGSLHAVLTAFIRVYGNTPLPRILILRGGTMNTVATSLNLKGTPFSILKKWLDSRLDFKKDGDERILKQATLKINDVYGFIGGAGMITRFLDAYYNGESTGAVQALKMLGRIIPGAVFGSDYVADMFRPVRMRVFHEGQDLGKSAYTAVLASTVPEAGLGFSLTHRCYEKQGAFHLIAADISPMALIPHIGSLWAGKPINHPGFLHHGPSSSVRLEHQGPLRWMIDGDMYESDGPLEISSGPVVEIIDV